MTKAPNFTRHLRMTSGLLTLACLVLLSQAVVTVALPWPVKFLIDRVLLPVSTGTASSAATANDRLIPVTLPLAGDIGRFPPQTIVIGVVLVLLLLAAINALLDRLEATLTTLAAERVVEGIRAELLALLLSRRQSFIEGRRKVDLLGRISGDPGNIEILIESGLSVLVGSLPTLALILVLMMYVDPRLSFLLSVALPLMFAVTTVFSRRVRKNLKAHRSEMNRFEQDAHQALAASALIKSLTLEPAILAGLWERGRQLTANALGARRAQGALTASLGGAKNFLRAFVVLVGGTALLRGQMTLGSLTLFLAYIEAINKPINELAKFSAKLAKIAISIERVEELYRDLQGQEETEGAQNQASLPFPDATTLRFDEVSFGYERGPLLLDRFSAEFHAGESVAVVGPSGVGKSTLMKLMNRLLDPVEGRILLGRTDLRRFRLRLLRNTVTLVHQDPFFVHGTIRENLRLATRETDVSDQVISEALRSAAAWDFVQSFPDKLETMIGEGGHSLSGGQAKRLSLARAFVRAQATDQCRIFVFDEPTSGLDPASAQTVLGSIRRLAEKGAIVFWVTHRLEEVQETDRMFPYPLNAPLTHINTVQETTTQNTATDSRSDIDGVHTEMIT